MIEAHDAPVPSPTDRAALDAALRAIFDDIPAMLNIRGVVAALHHRVVALATDIDPPAARDAFVLEQTTQILREIASRAVEEYTRRTGQPFWWVDEPDPAEDPANAIMNFTLDEKGNVVF